MVIESRITRVTSDEPLCQKRAIVSNRTAHSDYISKVEWLRSATWCADDPPPPLPVPHLLIPPPVCVAGWWVGVGNFSPCPPPPHHSPSELDSPERQCCRKRPEAREGVGLRGNPQIDESESLHVKSTVTATQGKGALCVCQV